MNLAKEKRNAIEMGAPISVEKNDQKSDVKKSTQLKPVIKLKQSLSVNKNDTQVTLSNHNNQQISNQSNQQNATSSKNTNEQNATSSKNTNEYTTHNRKFNKIHKCTYCEKKFTRMNDMYRHRKHYCKNNQLEKKELVVKQNDKNTPFNHLQTQNNTTGAQIEQLTAEITKLKEEVVQLKNQPSPPNIVINAKIDNHFYLDQRMVDLFEKTKQLHGPESAVKRAVDLISNKNKHNKHDWVKDPELMDHDRWAQAVKYLGKDPTGSHQFELHISQDHIIVDNGNKIDSILTDIIANYVIKSQNYIYQQIYEHPSEEIDWSLSDQTGIYQSKGINIHTLYQKFRNIKADPIHLVSLVNQ